MIAGWALARLLILAETDRIACPSRNNCYPWQIRILVFRQWVGVRYNFAANNGGGYNGVEARSARPQPLRGLTFRHRKPRCWPRSTWPGRIHFTFWEMSMRLRDRVLLCSCLLAAAIPIQGCQLLKDALTTIFGWPPPPPPPMRNIVWTDPPSDDFLESFRNSFDYFHDKNDEFDDQLYVALCNRQPIIVIHSDSVQGDPSNPWPRGRINDWLAAYREGGRPQRPKQGEHAKSISLTPEAIDVAWDTVIKGAELAEKIAKWCQKEKDRRERIESLRPYLLSPYVARDRHWCLVIYRPDYGDFVPNARARQESASFNPYPPPMTPVAGQLAESPPPSERLGENR